MDKIQKIKALLKSNKMTYQDLADAIGKSKPTVVNYFKGTSRIDIDTIETIANVLNVPVSYIFNEDTDIKKIKGNNNTIGIGTVNSHNKTNSNNVGSDIKDKVTIIENLEKINNFYSDMVSSLFSDMSDLYVDLVEKNSENKELLNTHETTTRLFARMNTLKMFSGKDIELNKRFYKHFKNPF